MEAISPCLWFDRRAEEAARFYTAVFARSRVVDVQRYGSAGPRRLHELFADPDCEKVQRVIAAMLQMRKLDVADLEAAAA